MMNKRREKLFASLMVGVAPVKQLYAELTNPQYRPVAFRVALVVGSILFTVNHGSALLEGKMNRDRWRSGLLTYIVSYIVSIHGQSTEHQKQKE